jgi:hypothetical protein
LVFNGAHEDVPISDNYPLGLKHVGTFTSSAPFCDAGSGADMVLDGPDKNNHASRLFTCADGSGSVTLWVDTVGREHDASSVGAWHILAGTGRYADLRGMGTFRGEFVSGDPVCCAASVVFRSTMKGVADNDTVAATVVVSSAKATKLRRPVGAYSVRLALSIHDNVEGNQVAYSVTATSGGAILANRVGSTASGSASVTLQVHPRSTARTVALGIRTTDPVGNEGSISRTVKLPRK